jgi:hypothetical protein
MTGETQGRPNHRMSRFSRVNRAMPGGAVHATLDERADAMNGASQWQRGLGDPYSEVIEVEFETVPPLPRAPEPPFVAENDDQPDAEQPTPPDIEAIAAALAEEMDRTAKSGPVLPEKTREAFVITVPEPEATVPEAPDIRPAPAIEAKAALEMPVAAPASAAVAVAARIPVLAGQAAKFTRDKIAPAVGHAALWLAHNLRRKEIRRHYGKALALVHGKVLDRRLERHFYISTLGTQQFSPDHGIFYEGPVPSKAFAWAMSELPADLREFAFVDFRAGRGRAMLLAAKRNFERIVGFEYGQALYDDLQMNLAQFPRSQMLCRNVQAFRGDRSGVSVPDQPAVLYFANAWREELLTGIMNYVRESYRHKPRRLYIVLENTDDRVTLPADEIFHRLDLPLAEKLKLRLLSPMDFQVYRSAV